MAGVVVEKLGKLGGPRHCELRFIDNRDHSSSDTQALRSYQDQSALNVMPFDQGRISVKKILYRCNECSDSNVDNQTSPHLHTSAHPEAKESAR
jgi:hypothetical protein